MEFRCDISFQIYDIVADVNSIGGKYCLKPVARYDAIVFLVVV